MLQIERREVFRRVSFLNQVVHELNTPLAAIKLHGQLMALEFRRNESVTAINDSVNRMVKLFKEITEINRKGVGHIALLRLAA